MKLQAFHKRTKSRSLSGGNTVAHEQTSREFTRRLAGLRTHAHRELVRLALATGRWVPSRVLARYPALLLECMKARAGYQP